jgi:3-oxoacyl-[acyl-carrier protein] reductase
MKYQIAGKKAIVCGASRGLGKGCAVALAEEGVEVTINGRNADVLAATADEIRKKTGVRVTTVAADITTAEGRALVLKACPQPDILVNNAGGPPPGDFRSWDRDIWINALDANMLTPIELIRATVDGMIGRRFGRIINITSSGVKQPIGILGLSNAARTGLTGFIAGLSRETVRHNVTINNLLPGAFDTDRRNAIIAAGAKASGRTEEQVRHEQADQSPAGRFGTIEEFGAVCAFLCSAQAGFITGQNMLLDGGAFPGTM